jgi:hypothetical protein
MRRGSSTLTENVSQLWNNMNPYSQEETMDREIALIHDGTTAGDVLCKLRIVREHHTSI